MICYVLNLKLFVFLFENQNLLSFIAAEYTTNLINYYYSYAISIEQ